MAETTAPVETAAPAPETAPAAPPPEPVSEAAKTLAARRTEIREALSKPTPKPANDNAAPAANDNAEPVAAAKPAEPSTDELVALIQQQRALKAERAAIERERAELKALQPHIERIKAAEAARAKGGQLAAIKALLPDAKLGEDLFYELAAQISSEDGTSTPAALTPEQLADLAAERMLAKQAADKAAADAHLRAQYEAEVAKLNNARVEYVNTCAELFNAHSDRFPAIAAVGLSPERIRQYVEEEYAPAHGGRGPREIEALQALEAELADAIRSTPWAAQAPATRPSPTVTSSWRSDPGRPAVADQEMTVAQTREAIKRKLAAGA